MSAYSWKVSARYNCYNFVCVYVAKVSSQSCSYAFLVLISLHTNPFFWMFFLLFLYMIFLAIIIIYIYICIIYVIYSILCLCTILQVFNNSMFLNTLFQWIVSTTGRIKCFLMGVIFGVVLLAFFTLSISLVTNPMLIKSLPGMWWK